MPSSVEQSFLSRILEAPDDDGPRLIYADWLDERGDPRGEFIRVQCQLASMEPAMGRMREYAMCIEDVAEGSIHASFLTQLCELAEEECDLLGPAGFLSAR